MRSRVVKSLIVACAVLAWPIVGYAQQQATLIGTVTDSTGAVLPGVTVTATHEASGNTFVALTDERGGYRLPVRTGGYRMTAELAGFTTVTRTGLELLLSQEAVVNFQLAVSTVQETVTVTGEAPLVDVTRSRSSGNIDTRQVQELPVNGRNFLDLTMLAPGSRATAVDNRPVPDTVASPLFGRQAGFQINLDGQQVTQTLSLSFSDSQPKFSRDAIAEFEFIANRFDATQGRSMGTQVNVITKSGTNTPSGSVSGYFRDDAFNAEDFVARRVLPYSNQQLSTTYGGPIRRNRVHVFGSYEFEREPTTAVFNTPFPSFNREIPSTLVDHKVLSRVDMQLSPQSRLTVRGGYWRSLSPEQAFGSNTQLPIPSSFLRESWQFFPIFTQVLSDRVVNEIKGGYYSGLSNQQPLVHWADSPLKAIGVFNIAPQITFRNFSVAVRGPSRIRQENYSVRDDLTISFNKGGRHDIKAGGEYYYQKANYLVLTTQQPGGHINAASSPAPGNLEQLIPDWRDVSSWNLGPLAPITISYNLGVGTFPFVTPRDVFGGWLQDDWKVTPRLTLNLGLRYDLELKALAENLVLEPWAPAGRGADTNNFSPRVGAAFSLNDRTVLRGGFGQFFGEVANGSFVFGMKGALQIATTVVLNDGRPDFVVNPFNGPIPTFEQVQQTRCSAAPRPGCVRLDVSQAASPELRYPYAYQASAGLQRQLGDTMAVEADYVYIGNRDELFTRNANLTYNPATGANYPFTDISRRVYPDWGAVSQWLNGGWGNYHSLQMLFTKRFSHGWQASATYLLSGLWNAVPAPDVGFPLAPDMGGDYTLGVTDQRHRATFNAIWNMPYGFQLSGLYFFGSGLRYATTYGGDLRRIGITVNEIGRVRPDGTIVPRTNFVGDPVHRVDMRLQRRFNLVGRTRIDGIVELFNVFNHANYGAYTTAESSPRYGQPQQNLNVAYAPRTLQLGFRFAF